MSDMSRNRTELKSTAPVGQVYWLTEFERVYLMTAARIRGEQVRARSRAEVISPLSARDA